MEAKVGVDVGTEVVVRIIQIRQRFAQPRDRGIPSR
jgi:hypothetical protein